MSSLLLRPSQRVDGLPIAVHLFMEETILSISTQMCLKLGNILNRLLKSKHSESKFGNSMQFVQMIGVLSVPTETPVGEKAH